MDVTTTKSHSAATSHSTTTTSGSNSTTTHSTSSRPTSHSTTATSLVNKISTVALESTTGGPHESVSQTQYQVCRGTFTMFDFFYFCVHETRMQNFQCTLNPILTNINFSKTVSKNTHY